MGPLPKFAFSGRPRTNVEVCQLHWFLPRLEKQSLMSKLQPNGLLAGQVTGALWTQCNRPPFRRVVGSSREATRCYPLQGRLRDGDLEPRPGALGHATAIWPTNIEGSGASIESERTIRQPPLDQFARPSLPEIGRFAEL